VQFLSFCFYLGVDHKTFGVWRDEGSTGYGEISLTNECIRVNFTPLNLYLLN
jgi:hypothetical protein